MSQTLIPKLTRLQRFRRTLIALHRDERGAEGLEKLLIIAAIVLPLLGLLIVFRGAISDWVSDLWGDVVGDGGEYVEPGLDPPG